MKSEPSGTKTLYMCVICKIFTYRITSNYNLCNRQSGDTIMKRMYVSSWALTERSHSADPESDNARVGHRSSTYGSAQAGTGGHSRSSHAR